MKNHNVDQQCTLQMQGLKKKTEVLSLHDLLRKCRDKRQTDLSCHDLLLCHVDLTAVYVKVQVRLHDCHLGLSLWQPVSHHL